MSDWLHNLPLFWMTLVIFAATYLLGAAIYLIVRWLAVGDRARPFKAVTPGVLSPLGVIIGLFIVFIAAQVWGDTDRANAAVNREASALRSIIILASAFPGETGARVRTFVRRYIEEATTQEWPMMAKHRHTAYYPAPRTGAVPGGHLADTCKSGPTGGPASNSSRS